MKNKNKSFKLILIMGLAILMLFMSFSTVNATTVDVVANGNITDALNNLTDTTDNTINLAQGEYNKSGENYNIIINKNVTIKGNGTGAIINGDGYSPLFAINSGLNVSFINVHFLNGNNGNYAYGGGAIYKNGTSTLYIENSIFDNNQAYYGGAIYSEGGEVLIKNSDFNNTPDGGAIYSINTILTVISSNFKNNIVYSGGGAIHANGSVNITNSTFKSNSAQDKGGAIALDGEGNLTVNNSKFSDNFLVGTSNRGGGAISINGPWGSEEINNVIIDNSEFFNNNAGAGGAIYNGYSSNLTIISSNFINNFAINNYNLGGGAIYNQGILDISYSNFTNNYVSNSTEDFQNLMGGAIYNYGEALLLTIFSSNFNNNSANLGGAIYNSYATFILKDSNFNNNTAISGGAIFADSGDYLVNITYNNFVNNTNNTITAQDVTNLQLNNNRIYDMDNNNVAVNITEGINLDSFIMATNEILPEINLDYNWWGNNTPDTNFNNINNYFVVNIVKNNLTNYTYTIRLNGTNNDSNSKDKLPSFNGDMNIDITILSDWDYGNFEANNTDELNILHAIRVRFVVDDWKIGFDNRLSIFAGNVSGSKYGNTVILNATIRTMDGNYSNIPVLFYINGTLVGSNSTDAYGNAYYYYKFPFAGNFSYKAVYNDSYYFYNESSAIYGESIKANTTIISNNPNNSKYKSNVNLTATLKDEYGAILTGENVTFYINDKEVGSALTGSDGIATFDYIVDFVGNYNFTTSFAGNGNYTGSNSLVSGSFIKANGIINVDLVPKDVTVDNNITITGNLTDSNGNLLKGNHTLKIIVNDGKKNNSYDVIATDGFWNLTVNNTNIGTTKMEISLNDPHYLANNKNIAYDVIKKVPTKLKTILTVSAPKITAGKKTNIVITLKDENGKAVSGKKISITSKFLKKPFTATTNHNGQITIRMTLPNAGKYTGLAEFAGDNKYLNSQNTIIQYATGIADLTMSKITKVKSRNKQLAIYKVTIKNIGKKDSPKTQIWLQHWKYNGWKTKIVKVNIPPIGAGKSLTSTITFLPDGRNHRNCQYQWFYINPLKTFKESSYKDNLKYVRP
ncbi:MAG: Ig-like domain repeat protein [Methanobrevibacter sp.]|nr:Ig-like domain repeat protein [Candidatus Methanoflexus mossambicus]